MLYASDAWNRAEAEIRICVMHLGNEREFVFEMVEEFIVMLDEGDIEFNAFLYAGIGEAVGNAYFHPVAFPCDPSHIGKVILVIGVLDMGDELSPFSGEMTATPEQIPGGAHVGRIHIGHGHHTTTQQGRYLIGVDFIVLGLASMYCFHIQNMSQNEWDILLCAEVCDPVPREDTFYSNNDIFTVRSYGFQKDIGTCFDIPMQDDLSLLVEDA